MTTSISLTKPGSKTSMAEALFTEIVNNANNYYYFIGRTYPWTNDQVEVPYNSQRYESQTREDIVYMKRVSPTDVSLTCKRYDWSYGQVFDMYDDELGKVVEISAIGSTNQSYITGSFNVSALEVDMLVQGEGIATGCRITAITSTQILLSLANTGPVSGTITCTVVSSTEKSSLDQAKFYCLTTENNVYKCLDNNKGAPSTVKPYITTPSPFTLADGYKWKYMYTLSGTFTNKFLTPDDMPVTTAVKNQYYTKGSISSVTILEYGQGYTTSGTSLIVNGDGHLRGNKYNVLDIFISNPGYGYSLSTPPTITVDDPFPSQSYPIAPWVASTSVSAGQYITVNDERFYLAQGSGILGSGAPTHQTPVSVYNGTVPLLYVGANFNVQAVIGTAPETMTTLDDVVLLGEVRNIDVVSSGEGYYTAPDVTITSLGTGTGASANAAISEGKVIRIDVSSGGVNYRRGTDGSGNPYTPVTIDPPVTADITWASGTTSLSVAQDDILEVEDAQGNRYYTASTNGTLTSAPVGTTLSQTEVKNGITFTYVGRTALAQANVYYGFGYSLVPQIQVQPPFDLPEVTLYLPAFASIGLVVTQGSKIFTDTGRIYTAIEEVTISSPPIHSTGIDGSFLYTGTTSLKQNQVVFVDGVFFRAAVDTTITSTPSHEAGTINNLTFEGTAGSVTWQPNLSVQNGNKVYTSGRFYDVTSGGNLGSIPPIGEDPTVDDLLNGTAELLYVGQTAQAYAAIQQTKAQLLPVIDNGQIIGVVISDPGENYSTASITVAGTGTNAKIVPNFSAGELNSRQASTELASVPGTIDSIKITNPGAEISNVIVSIQGDGTGAIVQPFVTNGSLQRIEVISSGTGYTYADVVIEVIGSLSAPPYARAILSPNAGHGRNAIKELFADKVSLTANFTEEPNQGQTVTNFYRQLGIIKNPSRHASFRRYQGQVGSTCYLLTSNFDYNQLSDHVLIRDQNNKFYRLVASPVSVTADQISVLVTALGNHIPQVGDLLTVGEGTSFHRINYVVAPDIDKYSGELMFIDNREEFRPTADQTLSLRASFQL